MAVYYCWWWQGGAELRVSHSYPDNPGCVASKLTLLSQGSQPGLVLHHPLLPLSPLPHPPALPLAHLERVGVLVTEGEGVTVQRVEAVNPVGYYLLVGW